MTAMTRKLTLLALVLLTTSAVRAQLYPVFSQYYFNELVLNPAYAGSHVQLSATSTYRHQWINFPGAPRTLSFTAHSSFVRGKVGLGLMVNQDKIGSYSNTDITMSYAYKIKMPQATFSFGLQGMLYFVGADFSQLRLKQDGDPSFTAINQLKPNIGAGLYYNRKNFFVGFSVPFLINSNFETGSLALTDLQQRRNYFLRSGLIKKMDAKGNFKINPSILVRQQEGQPLSVDLNMAVIFYDVISGGVSWRSGDAVIGFISLKLAEQLHFNYSYDFTSSNLRPFSSGTHEFMINYRYKISKVHKNLPCPTYWNYRE
jgi:type IX secretion system PorP/SprF family membrane protein